MPDGYVFAHIRLAKHLTISWVCWVPAIADEECGRPLGGVSVAVSQNIRIGLHEVLYGTRYGVRRVTVGEDEKCGRVRRHGEHDQRPPRNGRLPGVGSVLTVTVADGGDQLAQSRFRTVCYQHDLAPSPARM